MNKDLEVFENRSDDWLAKERKYEATVSAWDLDEGKKLRAEHEEDCEAREIKRSHELRHQAYNNQFTNLNDLVKNKKEVPQNKLTLLIVLFAFFIPMMIFVGILIETFGESIPEFILVIPIIVLILMVNVIKQKGRNK